MLHLFRLGVLDERVNIVPVIFICIKTFWVRNNLPFQAWWQTCGKEQKVRKISEYVDLPLIYDLMETASGVFVKVGLRDSAI